MFREEISDFSLFKNDIHSLFINTFPHRSRDEKGNGGVTFSDNQFSNVDNIVIEIYFLQNLF